MKILMLNYEFPPIGGGAGKANRCILEKLASRSDIQIDLLTSGTTPGLVTEKFAENITIHKVGISKKNLHYWTKLEVLEWLFRARRPYRQLLEQNNYDLAHAFFAFPSAWFCHRTAGKLPYIISLRGSDVPGYNVRLGLDYKLLAGLFRKIWNCASMVIANSTGLAKLANQFTPDIDIGIIPNGINTDIYAPSPNRSQSKSIRLLTVCRLIKRKRIDLLIRSVRSAIDQGLDVELNIAGQGNLMAQLKSLAAEIGVSQHVNFLGRVTQEKMPDLYRQNDIFVMASAHEGMSNAMLEAMASGLPIITTRCEGVEELINDNGIVLESSDPVCIAAAVKQIVSDDTNYRNMAESARQKAQQFTWQAAADKYLDCYRNVIGVRE